MRSIQYEVTRHVRSRHAWLTLLVVNSFISLVIICMFAQSPEGSPASLATGLSDEQNPCRTDFEPDSWKTLKPEPVERGDSSQDADRGPNEEDNLSVMTETTDAAVPWQLFTFEARWVAGRQSLQLDLGAHEDDVQDVVRAAIDQLNTGVPPDQHHYTSHMFVEGRYRNVPGVGSQYVVRLKNPKRPNQVQTVFLRRPFAPLETVSIPTYGPKQLVYMIVPYYARPDAFARFAQQFQDLVVAGEQLEMVVLFHTHGAPPVDAAELRQDYGRVMDKVRQINNLVRRLVARVELVREPFSRGGALLRGAASWWRPGDVLLFICDIDMAFNARVLDRCRANSAPGRSVYYPIVMSTYNPRLVSSAWREQVRDLWRDHPLEEQTGFWRDFGYGMVCQYKSDFDAVAGPFLVKDSWGSEDRELYNKYRSSGLAVVRVPDPDLVHVYHAKKCADGGTAVACKLSRLLSEGSETTWARLIGQLKEARNDEERVHQLLSLINTETDDVTPHGQDADVLPIPDNDLR